MSTVAPPESLTDKIMEARRQSRMFRASGEDTLADRWDKRVDELLDRLPRP